MSKYEVLKRFQPLQQRECALKQREKAIAKAVIKFGDGKRMVELDIKKQWEDIKECVKMNGILQRRKEILADVLHQETLKVNEIKEQIEQLETELESQKSANVDSYTLQLIDGWYCMQKLTGLYINYEALPHMFQGIIANETKNSRQWEPFCMDLQGRTPQEVQDFVHNKILESNPYKNEWNDLLLTTQEEGEDSSISVEIK